MRIKSSEFIDFRNMENEKINFSQGGNVIYGENAQGKTNILEGIYIFARGKSFRSTKDKELIKFGKSTAYSRLEFENERGECTLGVEISSNNPKHFYRNNIKVAKTSEIIGEFRSVLFCPSHLGIIKDSPSVRRKFLDVAISQLRPVYIKMMARYNSVMEERNAILKMLPEDILDIYSEELASLSADIADIRNDYIKKLDYWVKIFFKEMTNGKENPKITYEVDVQENDFEKVDRILKNILLDYGDDFSKHAPPSDIPKLGLIWDSVPKQLAKDNNKFMFSHVKAGKRAADLEDALQWLFNAGLLHKLECVTNAELPLSNNANGTVFKVYMSDVGLLRVKSGIDASTILEETPLYATFKGAFTENYVMNELVKQGLHPYFWRSENKAELDFLIEIKNELMPIEVKAEEHTKAKSYGVFCKRFSPKKGFVLSQKNIAVTNDGQTETLHLPLYLCGKMFR